jgi:hypothetical protein
MGIWAGWPGRAKAVGRPVPPRADGPALTRDEQRRFEEIARRIDQDVDEVAVPPTTAVIPARLAAVGLFVVAGTGILAGLARGDAVVLTVVGIVPAATAVLLLAMASARRSASAPSSAPPIKRFWWWLTTCAEEGCREHPVHLGWCREHAPRSDLEPDEFWG